MRGRIVSNHHDIGGFWINPGAKALHAQLVVPKNSVSLVAPAGRGAVPRQHALAFRISAAGARGLHTPVQTDLVERSSSLMNAILHNPVLLCCKGHCWTHISGERSWITERYRIARRKRSKRGRNTFITPTPACRHGSMGTSHFYGRVRGSQASSRAR